MTKVEEAATNRIDAAGARDGRSDLLKAAAIVGVVCIHAALPFRDVWRFGVPVFVALWAFHYEQSLAKRADPWPYVRTRFIRLFIPYLFWTTVYLLSFHSLQEWRTTPLRTIFGAWLSGYGWGGQYFFIVLFQLTWIYPLLRRHVSPKTLWATLIVGFALSFATAYVFNSNGLVSRIGDRLFVFWLPYVFLGAAFAQGFPRARRLWLLGACALFAAPAEMSRLAATFPYVSPYLLASTSVGSAAFLLALAPRGGRDAAERAPPSSRLARGARHIGRNSFPIFVCNPLFVVPASLAPFAPDSAPWSLVYTFATIVVAIAGSLAIGWVFRKFRLGVLVGA